MKKKYVYRDNESGRLITLFDAEDRDPSTWTEELVSVINARRASAMTNLAEPEVAFLDD
jgi:hypothetical protein